MPLKSVGWLKLREICIIGIHERECGQQPGSSTWLQRNPFGFHLQLHGYFQMDANFSLYEFSCNLCRTDLVNIGIHFLCCRRQNFFQILTSLLLPPPELDQASGLITYDTLCISEALRLSKHSKVNGMAVCHSSQCKVALLLGDGRIVFLKLAFTGKVCASFSFAV